MLRSTIRKDQTRRELDLSLSSTVLAELRSDIDAIVLHQGAFMWNNEIHWPLPFLTSSSPWTFFFYLHCLRYAHFPESRSGCHHQKLYHFQNNKSNISTSLLSTQLLDSSSILPHSSPHAEQLSADITKTTSTTCDLSRFFCCYFLSYPP